jgi:hypothetical protein
MKKASPWTRLSLAAGLVAGSAGPTTGRTPPTIETVEHLKDFAVIELRRYTIKAGERQNFADYFESFFPEAFEQIGAIAFGQFLERRDSSRFTWIRGFHTLADRAAVNGAFYDGPLWKEHRATMNGILEDSDDVLLLRPLEPGSAIPVLPAVDPVRPPRGARGIVAAQIFAVKPGAVDTFAREARGTFAGYHGAGAREAGVLVTLDVPNNCPRLPIRTDGPFLVWLGIFEDDRALERAHSLADGSAIELAGTGLLRSAPEWVVLEPTRRSRLRWVAP